MLKIPEFKINDKVLIKDNLLVELLRLEFTEETAKSFSKKFTGKKKKIYDIWTDKDSEQQYATIDLCCEVPLQCLELCQ